MGRMRRAGNIFLSLLMAWCCIELLFAPEEGLVAVAFVLGLVILAAGIRELVYYFTMARHMVSGLSILFFAIIAIDIGGLALALAIGQPKLAIVLYLACSNMYEALIGIVRAVESRMASSHWKANLFQSIVNLSLAIACIVFIESDQIVIALFCLWLFYEACIRFVRAVKPTEIIYIQ